MNAETNKTLGHNASATPDECTTSRDAIAAFLAAKHQIPPDVIKSLIRDTLECIEHITVTHGRCHFRGFGTFKVVATKAKLGRNVNTGEAVHIPARRKVTFTPCRTKQYKLPTETGNKPVDNIAPSSSPHSENNLKDGGALFLSNSLST